jgi:hypothetical protein
MASNIYSLYKNNTIPAPAARYKPGARRAQGSCLGLARGWMAMNNALSEEQTYNRIHA